MGGLADVLEHTEQVLMVSSLEYSAESCIAPAGDRNQKGEMSNFSCSLSLSRRS